MHFGPQHNEKRIKYIFWFHFIFWRLNYALFEIKILIPPIYLCMHVQFCLPSSNLHHHLSEYILGRVVLCFGEGNATPLQYSCLENPMDRGAWQAAVHGVAKSRARLSDFTFTFHFPALEKAMATHSSVLAWRIPGTGEPRGLLSMGLHRVRHD